MYRGHYRVLLGQEEASKIEKMLRETWRVRDIIISSSPACLKISFLTDDHKKVYRLHKIIENYGGLVLRKWIEKVNQ